MPGAWFEALIVAGLAILLWQPRTSWRRVVAAGIVLGTSATFAQVGEALILPGVIYLLAAGGGWRHAVGKAAALCAAFALPILAYCTGSYLLTGDFFLSHSGVTSFYGRAAAAADCATIGLPPPSGECARPGHSRPGDRTGSSTARAPRSALLPGPAACRDRQPDLRLQPQGADPAAAARARCLLPRRGEAVRADPHHQPGRHAHLPLAIPDGVPLLPAACLTVQVVRTAVDRFGGGSLPSGGRSPRSCAPTSSTAATPPARCWRLHLAGLVGGGPAAQAGGPRDPPARPCLPAVLHLGGAVYWRPTCSSSPGGTSCPTRHPRPGRRAGDHHHHPLDRLPAQFRLNDPAAGGCTRGPAPAPVRGRPRFWADPGSGPAESRTACRGNPGRARSMITGGRGGCRCARDHCARCDSSARALPS